MTRPRPSRAEHYRYKFICDIHEWLALAYRTLQPSQFAAASEEDITGELVKALNELAEDMAAPAWMAHLIARDEVPVNSRDRAGKRRKRIDIELVRTGRGPRPRFDIEAKRLYRSDSVSSYLGKEGLGCFIAGEYSVQKGDGGMLGYVQSESTEHWAALLAEQLVPNNKRYRVRDDGAWCPVKLYIRVETTYRTRHNREERHGPITIFHTLLKFC